MKPNAIIEKMLSQGVNEIVGGGDPYKNGELNLLVLKHLAQLSSDMSVLDFGCGCGRLAVPLLEFLSPDASYVGVDIVPVLLDFCHQEIAGKYPNAQFFQALESNKLYDKFKESDESNVPQIRDLSSLGLRKFDIIAAFSVFTHLSFEDSAAKLQELVPLLRPGGKLVMSCFLANESSRQSQKSVDSSIHFGSSLWEEDRDAYYIDHDGQLTAVAFQENSLMRIAREAHLDPVLIYYGQWCGRRRNETYQDIVVLTNTSRLPDAFDAKTYLKLNGDLPWPADEEGLERAKEHYLNHGYFEERRWK